ncbi:MAG TPA: hypothetical protein PK335_04670 [Draconibacterium sp.]|nr:hypothetical protein [Draconibacterium sp.]
MTEEDRLLLNDLKSNMQQLFSAYKKLEQEKKNLQLEFEELQNKLENLEHEKSEIGQQNEQLKIANQLLSQNDESSEAKQKINFLIREIDKCIALLNR